VTTLNIRRMYRKIVKFFIIIFGFMSTFLTKTYIYYTLFPITRNITFCRTRSLSNATFSFLIKWRSFTSKSAAVYKILPKSDDFSLKYGDIMIFKIAAVRHLELWIYHKMCSKCQPWTLTQADATDWWLQQSNGRAFCIRLTVSVSVLQDVIIRVRLR